MPTIFADIYNEGPGISGLHYIALGIALSAASQINARVLDPIYIHFKNKNGGVGEPEFRLRELLFILSDTVLILSSDNGPWIYFPSYWIATCGMVGATPFALDSNGHRTLILTVISNPKYKNIFFRG